MTKGPFFGGRRGTSTNVVLLRKVECVSDSFRKKRHREKLKMTIRDRKGKEKGKGKGKDSIGESPSPVETKCHKSRERTRK